MTAENHPGTKCQHKKMGEGRYWVALGQTVCERLFGRELLRSHLVLTVSLRCELLESLWNRGVT